MGSSCSPPPSVTVAIAVPILVIAALIEVYISPHLFTALTHIHPPIVRYAEGWTVTVQLSAASASLLERGSRMACMALDSTGVEPDLRRLLPVSRWGSEVGQGYMRKFSVERGDPARPFACRGSGSDSRRSACVFRYPTGSR